MNSEGAKNMIPMGIDISKQKLDICYEQYVTTIDNTEEAIRDFFKSFIGKEVQIVIEATGRHHRLAHKILSELGLRVWVINPYQSRHFAKALNIVCKTDAVDSRVLCLYAQRMPCGETSVLSEGAQEIQDLVRYLDTLKASKMRYDLRLKETRCEVT
jgi:transposase